jgi:hypothetical protein
MSVIVILALAHVFLYSTIVLLVTDSLFMLRTNWMHVCTRAT